MEYKFYSTGYISEREKRERKIQNIDTQEDPLRNILGRCKNIEKEVGIKDIGEIPTSVNGWRNEEPITSTRFLNWNPANGWSTGYTDVKEKKENLIITSEKKNTKEYFNGAGGNTGSVEFISISESPDKDATIFGPKLWYCLHNAAKAYPETPTKLVQTRMKNIILGIPYLISCASCYEHSLAYIDNLDECNLNAACSTRKNLIIFFVEFHNHVNIRLGKKIYKVID